MITYHVLYNPFAGNGWSDEKKERIAKILPNCRFCFHNMTEIAYDTLLSDEVGEEDKLLISAAMER